MDFNKTYLGISSQNFIRFHQQTVQYSALFRDIYLSKKSVDSNNFKILETEKHYTKRLYI